MRISQERLARLALLWSEAVGPAGFARLISHFGSALAVLQATAEELLRPSLRLQARQVSLIQSLGEVLDHYEQLWKECIDRHVHVVFDDDAAYPPPLRDIPTPPPVITLYGNWLPIDDPAVAIVGTRRPSAEGIEMAASLARACAQQRVTVISGLARGIDEAAHVGALQAGGRTFAVVGSGVLAIEPGRPAQLAARIAASGGIISEVAPRTPASVPRLLARNRITSGLARAVIVVQSYDRGGALVTADYARRQGRRVLAVPWPESVPQGAGTRALIEAGAVPVSSATEMVALAQELRSGAPAPPPAQPRLLDEQ